MTNDQLLDILKCSSGTISTVTGLTTYTNIQDFLNWTAENHESLPFNTSWTDSLLEIYRLYQKRT